MKQIYEAPEMETVLFDAEDVISTSTGLSFGGTLTDDKGGDHIDWSDLLGTN